MVRLAMPEDSGACLLAPLWRGRLRLALPWRPHTMHAAPAVPPQWHMALSLAASPVRIHPGTPAHLAPRYRALTLGGLLRPRPLALPGPPGHPGDSRGASCPAAAALPGARSSRLALAAGAWRCVTGLGPD